MESGAGLVQKSAWHCSVLHNWDAFATSLQAPRRQEAATGGVRPGTSEQCPEDNRSGSVCSWGVLRASHVNRVTLEHFFIFFWLWVTTRSQSSLAEDQDRLQECVGEMQSPRGKRESEWASARECAQNREFSQIELSRVERKTSKGTRRSNENVAHKSITFLI